MFPPSRRFILRNIARSSKAIIAANEDNSDSEYMDHITNQYTPTGFSVEEIRDLGRFPDYATFSGVPLPKPYEKFYIEKALPRPYRPFRWPYHQTMALSRMDNDWWIELDNTYRERIDQRKALRRDYGNLVMDCLPGSELACRELMEMVIQFLCARYPHYFSCDGMTLHNNILDSTQDITSFHPLDVLFDNIPEDFAIMTRDDKTGEYIFRAGIICYSMGWTLGDKLGLGLDDIHDPVPDYLEKIGFSIKRFFAKIPTDKPIQRAAWSIEGGKILLLPKDHPEVTREPRQDPNLRLEDCHLRVDWQTLRRLPLSGAVVFNFKANFTPVTEFRDEPGIPSLLLKILHDSKKSLLEYKKIWPVEHVIVPHLKMWKAEQEDKGVVDRNWEVSTLANSPYFEGWEDKWHHQQGF
ncbi:hypothetical protein BDV59DRAFT_208700 [Aspergillus ambiguus]|uniref:heme-dependent oxidative N-demethylase family protein n=1 Tax=Aspergillus ambiguus TaxID=176160 RepID=UPI003CCD3054